MAVVKDVICGITTNALKINELDDKSLTEDIHLAKRYRIKDEEIDRALVLYKLNLRIINVYAKTTKLFYCVLLEDGVQLLLQYMYIEKYMTEVNWFVIGNALVKLGLMLYFMIPIGNGCALSIFVNLCNLVTTRSNS